MADISPEDAEIQSQMAFRNLLWDARKCLESVNIASHSVNKIITRAEANILISQIEENAESHGVNLVINSIFSL